MKVIIPHSHKLKAKFVYDCEKYVRLFMFYGYIWIIDHTFQKILEWK